MADLEFYKLSMTGEEADSGIRTGMEAGATGGILLGDGNGGVTAATPGRDFGFPLLTGNGPPSDNTAANIGQHYFNMTATKPPYEYICVGLNVNGFVWIVYGDTGNGFIISGYFTSLEALEAAISAGTVAAPTAGTAYGIGAAAPYDIYVWDATHSTWVNNGPLGSAGGGTGDVTGIPPHGDAGQVLKKQSDADYDVGWGDAVPDGSITGAKIASGAVGTTQLAAGSITAEKVNADSRTQYFSATLSVSGWEGTAAPYTQTVNVGGMNASDRPKVYLVPPATFADVEAAEEAYGLLYDVNSGSGTATFKAKEKPAVAINVTMEVNRI